MKNTANDTTQERIEVKDLNTKEDVKGGASGVPIRDKDGNLGGDRVPLR